MKIGGQTEIYAVLGHPIAHTLSPPMHNAAFAALGMDAVYVAFDVEPERLSLVLPAMADMGFRGVNLTVPLKEAAFASLKDLDESARALGSVNTVEFLSGGMKGHSTDGKGFLTAIREAFGVSPEGLSILVLGAGGAGRAVAIESARASARRMALTDADKERPKRVAAEISRLAPATETRILRADPKAWAEAACEADMVIQATPIGMKKTDKSLLDSRAFRKGQMLFDLVYHLKETAIMKEARKAGVRVSNGLGMLLHQGAASFSIWTGKEAPVAVMRKALENEVYGTDR